MFQIFKYVAVGLICIAIDYILYTSLINIGWKINESKAVGVISSVIASFVLNAKWTFKSRPTISAMAKFSIAYTISIVLNVITNYTALSVMHGLLYSRKMAFSIATIFSACFNYVCLKFYVFKTSKPLRSM